MDRRVPPRRILRLGAVLLVVGAAALALSAWMYATVQTPAEAGGGGRALTTFQQSLDRAAQMAALGLGLLVLAIGPLVAGLIRVRLPYGRREEAAAWFAGAAGVLVAVVRWRSTDAVQFTDGWDRLLTLEALAWAAVAAAGVLLALSVPRGATAETTVGDGAPDLVHPIEAADRPGP